jgi:alkylation response protein AidB-like acyl-CoA dehydrogenase
MGGLDGQTLQEVIDALRDFGARWLTDSKLLELDARDEYPVEIIRGMCGPELGIQMAFMPEELHGMGGGSFDLYRLCEQMARIDVGIATGLFATFLGSEPISVGGTEEQKQRWLTRIADEGIIMAYGATEPAAGSDLGALRTTATRVEKDGQLVGYRLNGAKQWISNGGFADLYTILANAPGGPTWFVVDKGTPGLSAGKPEDKHGIRASNTAALALDEVEVPADRVVGLVEGRGLVQAQAVFGYTRLMVAAFGLGAGWAALDRAIEYSKTRLQGGSPLSEKQGYTHKLIVPHVARLEAARAHVEETSTRLDEGEKELNTEGAIAKLFATEAGNRAADASIQALGGYGYTREYMVEKIKRDVRITTIYEGTSEILEMTIARDRWQQHLKTRGQYHREQARKVAQLPASSGGPIASLALESLAEVMERSRVARLTRHQHVLLRLGELIALAETAAAFARRAAAALAGTLPEKADGRFAPEPLAALSRIFAREAAARISEEGLAWICGAGGVRDAEVSALEALLRLPEIHRAQIRLVADMDAAADAIYGRAAQVQQAA